MATLDDVKKNIVPKKVKGSLPYNFPPEVLEQNKKHDYVVVVRSDYGYDIVRRPTWLRDQKTRILYIFNERRQQKYAVFPEGTNICLSGWYSDEEECMKIIKSQQNHDHAVGLLEKAKFAFDKGALEAAASIVKAALTKESGNNDLLALKKVLIGEIEMAKADILLEKLELTETSETQEDLRAKIKDLESQLFKKEAAKAANK